MQNRVFWLHESTRHVAFLGEPEECAILSRLEPQSNGWRWEVILREGRFNWKTFSFTPSLLQCGFSYNIEVAMRRALDWMVEYND